MKIQVKIFASKKTEPLEERINKWLEVVEDSIEIIDFIIKLNQSALVITIIYLERKDVAEENFEDIRPEGSC